MNDEIVIPENINSGTANYLVDSSSQTNFSKLAGGNIILTNSVLSERNWNEIKINHLINSSSLHIIQFDYSSIFKEICDDYNLAKITIPYKREKNSGTKYFSINFEKNNSSFYACSTYGWKIELNDHIIKKLYQGKSADIEVVSTFLAFKSSKVQFNFDTFIEDNKIKNCFRNIIKPQWKH